MLFNVFLLPTFSFLSTLNAQCEHDGDLNWLCTKIRKQETRKQKTRTDNGPRGAWTSPQQCTIGLRTSGENARSQMRCHTIKW